MTPLNKDAFWDRRLKQSHDELQRIVKIGTKYKDDPATLRKKMKKEKKYIQINIFVDTFATVV